MGTAIGEFGEGLGFPGCAAYLERLHRRSADRMRGALRSVRSLGVYYGCPHGQCRYRRETQRGRASAMQLTVPSRSAAIRAQAPGGAPGELPAPRPPGPRRVGWAGGARGEGAECAPGGRGAGLRRRAAGAAPRERAGGRRHGGLQPVLVAQVGHGAVVARAWLREVVWQRQLSFCFRFAERQSCGEFVALGSGGGGGQGCWQAHWQRRS